MTIAAVASPPSYPAAPRGFTSTDTMLAGMVFLWGINFIVIKAALGVMSPLAFNGVRFPIAALLVGLVAWASGGSIPDRATLLRLGGLGVLGNTVYQVFFITGVAHTRAGNAALIMAAVPVQTAVLSHLRGHERLRGRDAAGLLISLGGIAVIVLGGGREVGFSGTLAGDLLMLGATVCWSVYTIFSKPYADSLGAVTVTAWTMILGAVPLLLISLPAMAAQDWSRVGPPAWGAIAFSAVGSLGLAYLIWYRGVRRLGPSRTAMYSNFTPVVALLAAWPLLHEVPTLWQLGGAAGIFGGIWLTRS